MIKNLTFGTTNESKLSEASSILGLEVKGVSLEVDEIQSLDPDAVALDKAKKYYQLFGDAIFIEDVSLTFHGLGKLPGTFMDYFSKSLSNERLCNLLANVDDKSATALTTIVFIEDLDNYQIFRGEIRGKIVDKPRGENGFGWDPIFMPEGSDKTYAEMDLSEKNVYSMRRLALEEFVKWLKENK